MATHEFVGLIAALTGSPEGIVLSPARRLIYIGRPHMCTGVAVEPHSIESVYLLYNKLSWVPVHSAGDEYGPLSDLRLCVIFVYSVLAGL